MACNVGVKNSFGTNEFAKETLMDQNNPILATAESVASMLSISLRTLWRMRSAGKLPAPVRVGKSTRWRVSDIQEWIAAGCPVPMAPPLQKRKG
ncbi:Prophage CP4-57 regulatory [Planctopirus limnophila DSM 3776]|uniref:Prophage CP4-57 regulatory n=2 Tax=Planctopirus limnophila TaxID=120 RepID=D5SQK9_PLAL2|nr:Prophage CP4-57 regulatory [Planctopirus limnophila DSM 3776]